MKEIFDLKQNDMTNTQDKVIDYARRICAMLRADLPNMKQPEAQRNVFEKYITVFHPHFIVWVAGMQNSCSSTTGKYAAADNIELELIEDHQKMLFDFMGQLNIYPNNNLYKKLQPAIDAINQV
ncbi:MAG TPA: hypothetical protein PLJ21_13835, partial [Pseudobdellovibrionaceae bacterium]|nr:hypothetical protein [Pseudobdellovibrionaceae bacterium]